MQKHSSRKELDKEKQAKEQAEMLAKLKDRLTKETNEILKAQQESMAQVLGQLQVVVYRNIF